MSAWVRIWQNSPDDAVEHAARAIRLSPLDPQLHWMQATIAHALYFAGRYDEASLWAGMALQQSPDFPASLRIAAASNALAGRLDKANEAVARLRQINPELRIANLRGVLGPYRRPEDFAKYEEGMRKAGLPE
jgi:tetratricopeptide (TPR) repeat protein